MRNLSFLTVVAFSCFSAIAENSATIPLWPNGAPGSEGKTDKELVEQWNNGESIDPTFPKVWPPSISISKKRTSPPNSTSTRPAVTVSASDPPTTSRSVTGCPGLRNGLGIVASLVLRGSDSVKPGAYISWIKVGIL